jgi:hypothetical protein
MTKNDQGHNILSSQRSSLQSSLCTHDSVQFKALGLKKDDMTV